MEAIVWVHAEKAAVSYSVTVGVAPKRNLVAGQLNDSATVTAQAKTWITSHTG